MRHSSSCVLAVDAGGTFLKAALVLPDGHIAVDSFMRIPVDSNGDAQSIQQSYISLSAVAADKALHIGKSIAAIGVCIPGPFDYKSGISLMTHKYAAINGLSLRPWLAHSLGAEIPMSFIHDSNAFLLGALKNERFADISNAAGVTIGTGLGFATLLDGRIATNANGGPYISIYAQPFLDGTGEDFVSRRAIIAAYARQHGTAEVKGLDVAEIADLACEGEPDALLVFRQMGLRLGAMLSDILSQYEIECLLLGGAISKSAGLFLPAVCEVLSDLRHLRMVQPADDIDMAPIIGAAQTVMEMVLY